MGAGGGETGKARGRGRTRTGRGAKTVEIEVGVSCIDCCSQAKRTQAERRACRFGVDSEGGGEGEREGPDRRDSDDDAIAPFAGKQRNCVDGELGPSPPSCVGAVFGERVRTKAAMLMLLLRGTLQLTLMRLRLMFSTGRSEHGPKTWRKGVERERGIDSAPMRRLGLWWSRCTCRR